MLSEGVRLQGVTIRDEFLCPITVNLLRDPVVAADGHTYERQALEMWISTNRGNSLVKSPKTNEMMKTDYFPNFNLKRLIQDLIREGGMGLYCKNNSISEERMVEVRQELILLLKCTSSRSECFNKVFEVRSCGILGGRSNFKEEIQKGQEVMILRESEISRRHFQILLTDDQRYGIRDLGSTAGTFIRIDPRQKKELHPGMILLIGRHQFTVSSIIVTTPSLSHNDSNNDNDDFGNLSMHVDNLSLRGNEIRNNCLQTICTLTCCQPEGSPILGKSFSIGEEGATIGRGSSCIIPIAVTSVEDKVRIIDDSISSEHASIQLDRQKRCFIISDGVSRPSTNGVWWRVSGPLQESSVVPLSSGMEFLVGSVRFEVKESISIAEKEIAEAKDSAHSQGTAMVGAMDKDMEK